MATGTGKADSPGSSRSLAERIRLRLRQTAVAITLLSSVVSLVYAQIPGPVNLQGTGGTITTPNSGPANGYVVHTFTSSGTFTPPPGVTSVDVLVVAGGGGGGRGGPNAGGGGGAGGMVEQTNVTVAGPVTVTVGGGGAGGSGGNNAVDFGDNGQNSVFSSPSAVTAVGGGGGGSGSGTSATSREGRDGGSGGGGGGGDSNGENGAPGAGTGGQGNSGGTGNGRSTSGQRSGGGGGGAGAAGTTGVNSTGGAGGAGATSALFGGTYAGGGGGANTPAAGGSGGGGAGTDNTVGGSGTANTGGGGGGARNANGGAGGSGVVIVRYQPPTLTISQQPSSQAFSGQALPVQPSVTLLNGAGNPVSGVTVTASVHSGTPTLGGTLTAVTNGSGVATFTNLTLTGTGNSLLRLTVAGGANNFVVTNQIQVVEEAYFVEISHAGDAGTCAATPVTVTIYDAFDQVAVDFTGQITITASPGVGNWANSFGGLGTFNNGTLNDGIATYTFNTNDNGVVQLGFTAGANNYTFNVTGPDIDGVNDNGGTLAITACQFRISHDGVGNVCAVDQITIRVTNAAGTTITGYTGTVNLSTNVGAGGNWSKTSLASDANGTLTPGALNSGAATYNFVASDAGDIILNYQTATAGTVNFNIVAAGVSAPTNPNDPDLVVSTCVFRITHSGSSDVCSIEEVTITLVDGGGNTVTNYTGSINLSTTTGFGTWSAIGQSDGTLTDPVNEDGSATYQFVSGDLGTITLGFRHVTNSGPVNINVSDGVSQDARNPANMYDQNITIALCTFEISHGLESNACSITPVTFTVRNSTGGIATDYVGTMRITNNSNRGDWQLSGSAEGSISAPSGPDVGIADYVFSPDDDGVVILDFYSTFPAIINFDADDGVIVENGAFDPNLFYVGCFPQITAGPACTNPGTSTNVIIPAQNPVPELRSRAVLMATMQIGDSTDAPSVYARFNGVDMTRIARIENTSGGGVTTEIWAIFDDDLPVSGGSYTGQFFGGVGSPAICLVAVEGVEQGVPIPSGTIGTPAAQNGPVNGSTYSGAIVSGFFNAESVITTLTNNVLIFSVAANNRSSNLSLDSHFWRPPQPGNTLTGIWGGRVPSNPNDPPYREATLQANPTGGKTAGSAGVLSSAGVVEVVEPFQTAGGGTAPTANAHVVAAFNPLVSGAPLAEGYVPVLLYETWSGPLNYQAIGSSLRTQPSPANLSVDPAFDCAMVNFGTGTTADLTMPSGSSVVAAYLYWGGSGTPAQADNEVMFGVDGNEFEVIASEVFIAEGVTDVEADFFGAYANVTNLVTGNATYRLYDLTVQTGNPWNTNGTCAGGWNLVVVYENNDEHLRVINLFHGFQPFQYSSFTLVPRNFRMATYDENLLLPNGQVTHVTIESDEQLATGNESLAIQTAPNALTFEPLFTSFNPENGEFNSTITRPLYWLGPSGYIEFVGEWDTPRDPPWTLPPVAPDQGLNGDGYEIDFPGPDAVEAGRTGNRIGASWGFDIDTHYLSHTLLENFAQPNAEAERITTRYRAGQDMVILMSEVISITNFPIADLEVFISQSGTFKVNGTGSYQIDVTNNGNGSNIGGEATGIVTVAMRMPTGMTFANAGDVSGTGWSCSVTLSPGAFTCNYNIATTYLGGELPPGDNLPPITVNVQLGGPAQFPLQSNTAKATVRMLHHGGSCDVTADGFIPDPTNCNRAPQFDNVNDTQGDTIDIDTLVDKSASNNNVHSVTTTVTGILTNLRLEKEVADTLETDQPAQYLLTVTNLGPDATTVAFTLSDSQPAGVEFTAAAGTNWSCSTITPVLNCTFNGTLALNAATVLTLDVNVVGNAGFNVTNTAQVTVGTGNFDVVPANNAATDVTTIVGPPVSSQERFLLSVNAAGNATTIGGLGPFENDDLIIYDPSTDEAIMFFDDSVTNGGRIDDINAVHLLKNGHIVISANGPSIIGTNNVSFDPWDLVRYDPILGTASLFLDGETVFQDHEDININGLYVMDDCAANNNNMQCSVILTTTTGGVIGSNSVSFTASDLVILCRNPSGCVDNTGPFTYNLSNGQAAIYLEGSDEDVFGATEGNGNVDIDAFYLRVSPSDPKAVRDIFVLSVDNEEAIIGEGLDPDPLTGTVFTRDDVTELDLVDNTAENLFLGDVELGVFEPTDAQRRLDALHLVEDGYIGHFSIRQVQGGSVCEAGVVRVSKHDGLGHGRDLDYYGSVRLSTSTNYGTWQLQSGNGVLTNNGAGQAVYTYDSSDQGTAIFRLVHDQAGVVNIAATNGIARETASEDPNFNYDPELTLIVWGDDFASGGFTGKTPESFIPAFDGFPASRNWEGGWVELDRLDGTNGSGLGAGVGNIQVVSGRLRIKSSVAAANANNRPEISRVYDVDAVPVSEDVILHVGYSHTALPGAASVILEARGSSSDSWVSVNNFTNMTSNQESSTLPVSYNLSTILTAQSQSFSDTSEIRFRVANGLELTGQHFFVDYVLIESATDQCGYTSSEEIDHYAISHSGFGIACIGSPITITAHDGSDDPIDAEGETINLSTSPAKGVWARVLTGNGTLTPIGSQTDNGQAQYIFGPGESSVTLLLNYTVPAGTMTPVNINVLGQTSTAVEQEDPTLEIAEAGLVFYNETDSNTLIPTQIAGKPSNVNPLAKLLTIQGVRSSDQDPMQCVPLFDNGQTLEIELAAECIDANQCVNGETFSVTTTEGTTDIALVDSNGGNGASAYTPVEMGFVTQPSGDPGATIVLNYSDVGRMQLHGRYNIPFGFFGTPSPDDPLNAPGYSGDFMLGSSNQFVVRPFGFAIDFPGDEGLDRRDNFPVDNFEVGNSLAVDPNGTAWKMAGADFDVTVIPMAWESEDDSNNDGVPDTGANLHDNRATPNFYMDSDGAGNDYRVEVSVISNQAEAITLSGANPADGVIGVLSGNVLDYSDYDNAPTVAMPLVAMSYNEVGIIDLQAQLIDSNDNPTTYLGTSNITGRTDDVGRFYPARFTVDGAVTLLPRVSASCAPPSVFTYMGEPFGLSAMLTARNVQGDVTVNYRGAFAKLSDYAELNLRAIEEVDNSDNTDRSSRLQNVSIPSNLQGVWSSVNGGQLLVSGNLIFNRANPADPDGPFEDLIIAFVPVDDDGVTLEESVLDAEILEGNPEYLELAREDFRYGRLFINNAYGPETEDLAITFRVEYFDGERFVINTDDSCTVINSDELTLLEGTETGDLLAEDTEIVAAQTSTFHNGQIQGVQAASNPTDATLTALAAGLDNAGTIDIELDLSATGLNLPFLQFKWPHEDNDYDENPRATIEFGQFRAHDRVINWQEIYNGPTP